ncbi:MAG: hypothetical protein L3J68_00505 [Thermoplasmata archaeon]|nr:hypothetical protein [Thermoplasmata archaeon]
MSSAGPPIVHSASPSDAPSGPSHPPSLRGWLVPVVVVAVIALVVLAALFATGTIRLGASNSSNPTYETFSQAQSVADGGAGSVAGGPWFAEVGVGVATPTAVLEPTTNLSGLFQDLNCSFDWPTGEPANLEVPATPASASIGTAAFWAFGLKNTSNGLLVETVSDGVSTALLEASGAKCAEGVGSIAQFSSAIIDSPTIVATANQAGGSAFLLAHPNSTMVWGVFGGFQLGLFGSTSPEWGVEYTSCVLPLSAGETGDSFNATIGGTSGALLSSATGATNCDLTLPSGLGVTLLAHTSAAGARKAI